MYGYFTRSGLYSYQENDAPRGHPRGSNSGISGWIINLLIFPSDYMTPCCSNYFIVTPSFTVHFSHSLLLLSRTDQLPLNVSVGLKKFNPNFPIYMNPPTVKGINLFRFAVLLLNL